MADEQQGNLPIEELGIDLVVNSGDNFVSDMSKAGRQMTTFSGQIGRLVNSLPMLNLAMQDLSTQLSNINNRVSNVKKVAGALDQLGKMPNTVKNIGTNAANAALAVDKLYTSLENAQARMRKLRTEEYAMRLEMQRKQGPTKGTVSTGNVTGPGTKETRNQADAADLARFKRESIRANLLDQAKSTARKVTSDPRFESIAVPLKLDLEEGKIGSETKQVLLDIIRTVANESRGAVKTGLEELGANVAGGLTIGMAASEEAVIRAGATMAQHLLVAIADTLETHSPSRATRRLSYQGGVGFALGADDAGPEITAAGQRMGERLMDGISSSLDQLSPDVKARFLKIAGSVDDVGPSIRRKTAKLSGELEQMRTGQGPLNDRDFETDSGMNARVDAALQARIKASEQTRQRANKVIENVVEASAFLLDLDPEVRDALKAASQLRVARKLTSNRGENVLYQGAVEDSLLTQMELAGARGTAPGTEAIGSQKVRSAYVPALGKVARWKKRGGAGVSMGHNAGQRDFSGALYQKKMQAYADLGGLDAALANVKPDSPEWQALYKGYSPVTASFPWQPQPARTPKNFNGDKERLEQATAAAAKYIIKAMGLDRESPSIQHKRLGSQEGTANFNKLFDEMPEMQPFRDINARDAKQYLREQLRVGIDKQRVVDKQGDPQIEQATSAYYQKAHEIIGRQDATLSEIISGLEEVNNQIKADLRAKFETTQAPVFKMLSERDDPVISRTIAYLKKFGNRQSTTNPGQTVAEVLDAWANVWDFLKEKFGGQQGANEALSAYEHYVNKIETPTMREDLMPDFPMGLQVRRVRGAPRPVDKALAEKHAAQRYEAQLAFRDTQHYPQSRIRNAADFRDAQGSRKIVTQFEQQKIKAQVPDSAAIGVDREKVLEASNAAVSIEWELKAQEDAINKAAEAYAKKNGRTLKQVNQAVENVRTGKNKTPGEALKNLAKMVAAYDLAVQRWEDTVNAYVEKALAAEQAASKSIGKGIAKGELRTTSAKYFDADGKAVNPEGMNVRTRNLTFRPGGLVRGADGKPEVFDTSRTKREYQPEMLGSTAVAAYAPAYKKPRGYRAPELTDKERIRRANRAAEIQAELGGQYNAKLGQTYGGFKPPTKKAFAGGDLEKAARTFGTYSRDFNELLRIKTSELGVDVKTALQSINDAANNYIGSAIKYVEAFKASGFLEKGAAQEFNAALINARGDIIELKNRAIAGENVDPADVKVVVKALHERIKTMGITMEAATKGLDQLEQEFDKSVADEAAAAQAKTTARQAGGWQAANSNQARGWRAANGSATAGAAASGAAAAGAAAKQTGTFTFPDDWVIRLVNAIGQAADKIVAAVRGIRIELKDGGVAENVGPTEAQIKAGRRPQTDAEKVRGLANTQADLIRTSEVDAYRASHTAMRQVRQANDLNPNEVKRLQAAIDAWRAAAIKDATDSIKQQAERGDVVDAFRASRSQSDLDLQKIVGPEIRKSIQNQETAVSEREMRTLKTAFDDIARAERNTITALQKSGAPAQQLAQDMKAISAAAELAREDVVGFSQSAESFQILDAQVDQVVNSFKEMGEQAKFAARQADRTPLMQKQLAVRTRADSITRDAERLKANARDLSLQGVPQTEIEHIIKGIDQAAADATHELAVLLNEARAGGIGAGNSMAAFNLQLQKIRASASEDIDILRRLITLTKQNVPEQPKQQGPQPGVSDVDRAIGAKNRSFKKTAALGMSVANEPFANQGTVMDLLHQLAELKAQTDRAVERALADTANASGSERANAVREAIGSTKAGLDGITESLRNIERVSRNVTSEFQKIDHAASDTRGKIADLGAGGRARIDSAFASSLAVDLDKVAASAVKKFEPTMAGIKTRLSKLYADARQAAMAGDKAAVSQLVWEIRKLTDTAEAQVDASLDRILARADQIDRQVKGIQQVKDWAKDPQSFLQERVVGNAKKGGVTGWINRTRLNFQEADATAEMFKNVQKAKLEMNDLEIILRTLKNTIGGVFFGITGVFKVLTAPVWAPIAAGIAIFKGLRLAIDGVSGAYKKLRYMIALPGKKKELAAGLNEDERGQRYADTYANYTALFEKMNRTSYNKATAGKKFFATPGFDKASMDRQAKDFGSLQAAYDKLQKAAIKQGMMDRPVTAVGRAAAVATAPVRKLADVLTLGASASARETKKLNAEMARAGTTAEAAGVKVKRSGLFGAKIVSTQPRQADGRFASSGASMGFNDIVSPATQANAKRGMKKLFADMGTGVGMGFGMSFSMGIINSIQNMGWRIQSAIGGVISNGMSAIIETEMRKMTIQSFVSQEMMDSAGPTANFGDIWTDAQGKANDYYQQIVDIAKISSFSRAPLLDVFNNMQVGGLSAENAASVTRAATMFGDAFMPGQKQMLDTFGQQMMQMLSQGVAQQMDLKLLAQQGIPVYDMLAKNLPQYQGMDKNKAQGQIFDDLGKGQIGATQALEAITKGMVDAAENMKGKVATTFSGLMSTFQDLMLEKSEAIMGPVAENLMKPFIEFGNDFLQSNPVTDAIKAFGEQINTLSQSIMTGVATAMGVMYGLWNALPAPIQNTVKAIASAVAIMGGLTAAIASIAAIGALLAPMFGVITTGMLMATGAIGAFIGAWMTNLMGFRDWLTGWATWAYNWAVYLGKSLADGLLTNVGEFSKAGAAAINGFMANFMGNMESIYASLQAFGQNIYTTLQSVGQSAGAAFDSGWQQVGASMGQLGDWVNAAIEWLWALPQNAWDVVKSVVEAFWEVPKNLEGIGQAMWSWGENVVTMFAQGMQGAINVVFDALQAIGDMFTEWLEPGSPPKLLPDLTVWGTGAADAYLEGWTKADFGIMNDLAGKLEEAFAIDEGAMKQGELAAVRGAVADMVDKAIGGTVDTSAIMNAIPGWGGRAESVQRLADAYANLAMTQHGLTVEQEALDRITAQYDARLKPLQSKLESIRNKQEALDLTSQIKEYQNVLDNVYATDEQKKAASLKMDELKLTQDINNIEMDRDKLTDPINDRIGQLTYENMLAQDAVDIANERWAIEVGMLKAGSKKDGAGGGADAGTDAAGKDPKDAAGGAGTEKNRQFTQPKLNVPGITGKGGLGAIGSKMQELSDKIKGYFSDMGEKAKPLVDAFNGMGAGVTTIKEAIDAGFTSGAFSSDKGFAGFLNNVGAALAQTATNIDTAKTSIAGFVTQVQTAWSTPFGDSMAMGPVEEGAAPAAGSKDFGGFKQIGKDANEQATLVQRAQAVVTVVIDNLGTVLDDTKLKITTFATDIGTTVSAIDWVTIQTNFQTGIDDTLKKLTEFGAGVVDAIMSGLGVSPDKSATDNLSGASGKLDQGMGAAGDVFDEISNKFTTWLSDGISKVDFFTAGAAAGASAIIIASKFIVWLTERVKESNLAELASAAGAAAGQAIAGAIVGAIFGGMIESAKSGTLAENIVDLSGQVVSVVVNAVSGIFIGIAEGVAKVINENAAIYNDNNGLLPDIPKIDTKELEKNYDDMRKELGNITSKPVSEYAQEAIDFWLRKDIQAPAADQMVPGTAPLKDVPVQPTRDRGQETYKSILNFDFASMLPQVAPPTGVVPFTDVPQTPAWETVSTPQQKAKAPEMPAIKMDLGGLDPAKMFQGQVTAATTAGTAAGANFSKAYSTATTTALSSAATTGKNVFTPVEKGAPESAKLTWSSFLTGLQQAGGNATTQAGAQSIGTDVIGGIVQGALSTITTSPLLAMVPTLLVKFFQSSLGIQSPSLVFDQMVGQPIGEGIIQGLNTVLTGGGTAGMTPQMIMDTMFLNIMNSMGVFTLNTLVAWYNFKSSISTILLAAEGEWMEIFDATFEEANTRFDEFAANWVEEKVPEFKDALIELAMQAKDGFLDAMQQAVDGLQDKINEMLDLLGNEDLLGEFYEKGENLGENIADGIAAGMTSRHAAGEFAHAAEKIVDMINDAIAAAAQIESPSKVMAREIGIPLSAGIAVGMTSPTAQRYLADSSGNVIEQIVRNFQGASTAQVVTARYVRQPEENMVSMQGVTREYHMHLNVTPQMAERVNYNFSLLETMYG